MSEFAKAIAEFLKLNERTAFALFAAGLTLWLLIEFGVVSRDPAELTVAYLAGFGFFVWAGYLTERAVRYGRQRRQQRLNTQTAAKRAEADAERSREIALDNLAHLGKDELEVMRYIHHRGLTRVRASHRFHEFENLVNMKVLVVEDKNLPYHDRFFAVPDYVLVYLRERLGAPDPGKVGNKPPWEGKKRGWVLVIRRPRARSPEAATAASGTGEELTGKEALVLALDYDRAADLATLSIRSAPPYRPPPISPGPGTPPCGTPSLIWYHGTLASTCQWCVGSPHDASLVKGQSSG